MIRFHTKKKFPLLLLSFLLLPFFLYPAESLAAPTPELDVVYHVKTNKLYLEFHLRHFTLQRIGSKTGKVYGEGHIHLHLDGKKAAEIDKPVHVLSHLPPGKHVVKVELVHLDHSSYGIYRTFPIEVK